MIALSLLLVHPCARASEQVTWTTVRVRARPSTDSDTIELLAPGTRLQEVGRQGSWVETDRGFVHGSLLGARWIAPPIEAPPGLLGRVVGREDEALHELSFERGLCRVPLADGEPVCLPISGLDEQTLERVWDRDGRVIQTWLARAEPVRVESVDPLDHLEPTWRHLITPAGPVRSVSALTHAGRPVWTSALELSRTRLGGHLLDGDWLVVRVEEDPLDGSPPTSAVRLVDLRSAQDVEQHGGHDLRSER